MVPTIDDPHGEKVSSTPAIIARTTIASIPRPQQVVQLVVVQTRRTQRTKAELLHPNWQYPPWQQVSLPKFGLQLGLEV
jgi:hypothetical protein